MSKRKVSGDSVSIGGHDDAKHASLTRDDVAKRLGISISTVRRMEGSKLHPVVTASGVRRFKPAEIEQLAGTLAANQNKPRNAAPAVERSPGEVAALVFERLEQRHSLAEIVIALRISPDEVRELYHTWLVGLWSGELQRAEPALPQRHTDQDVVRRVTRDQLAELLAGITSNRSTRISLARVVGEYTIGDGMDIANFVECGIRTIPIAETGGCRSPKPDHGDHRNRHGDRRNRASRSPKPVMAIA